MPFQLINVLLLIQESIKAAEGMKLLHIIRCAFKSTPLYDLQKDNSPPPLIFMV